MIRTLKAARSSYVVWGVMILPVLILSAAATVRSPAMWVPVGICVAFAAVIFVWLARFALEIDAKQIKYSSLLGGTKVVAFDELAAAELRIGYSRWSEPPTAPMIRLVLFRRGEPNQPAIAVNLK